MTLGSELDQIDVTIQSLCPGVPSSWQWLVEKGTPGQRTGWGLNSNKSTDTNEIII